MCSNGGVLGAFVLSHGISNLKGSSGCSVQAEEPGDQLGGS